MMFDKPSKVDTAGNRMSDGGLNDSTRNKPFRQKSIMEIPKKDDLGSLVIYVGLSWRSPSQ